MNFARYFLAEIFGLLLDVIIVPCSTQRFDSFAAAAPSQLAVESVSDERRKYYCSRIEQNIYNSGFQICILKIWQLLITKMSVSSTSHIYRDDCVI